MLVCRFALGVEEHQGLRFGVGHLFDDLQQPAALAGGLGLFVGFVDDVVQKRVAPTIHHQQSGWQYLLDQLKPGSAGVKRGKQEAQELGPAVHQLGGLGWEAVDEELGKAVPGPADLVPVEDSAPEVVLVRVHVRKLGHQAPEQRLEACAPSIANHMENGAVNVAVLLQVFLRICQQLFDVHPAQGLVYEVAMAFADHDCLVSGALLVEVIVVVLVRVVLLSFVVALILVHPPIVPIFRANRHCRHGAGQRRGERMLASRTCRHFF